MAWHGFGGWKSSLFCEPTPTARRRSFYTRQKSIMQRSESTPRVAEFAMPTAK